MSCINSCTCAVCRRRIQPIMLGGAKASYFGPGVRADARGAQRAESWVEFSGRGSQLEVWAKRFFSCILEAPDGISWKLLGAKFGMAPLPPPPEIRLCRLLLRVVNAALYPRQRCAPRSLRCAAAATRCCSCSGFIRHYFRYSWTRPTDRLNDL